MWFRGDIVRRNKMRLILRGQGLICLFTTWIMTNYCLLIQETILFFFKKVKNSKCPKIWISSSQVSSVCQTAPLCPERKHLCKKWNKYKIVIILSLGCECNTFRNLYICTTAAKIQKALHRFISTPIILNRLLLVCLLYINKSL